MKKKKKWFVAVFGVVALVGIGLWAFPHIKYIIELKNTPSSYDQYVEILNDTYPSDVVVFGDPLYFKDSFRHRRIEMLTEEEIVSQDDYEFRFLVINDLQGTVDLTEEDLKRVKEIVDSHSINFYYVGTRFLEELKSLKFYESEFFSGYRSIGYVVHPYNQRAVLHGIYTDVEEGIDPDRLDRLLETLLIFNFVDGVIRYYH